MADDNAGAPRPRYRIEIKLSADEKALITRGAAVTKQSLAEFVRTAAENAAKAALSTKRDI